VLPSEYRRLQREKAKSPKPLQKISNTFIESAIQKSNLNALKTIYYLSTILEEKDLSTLADERIINIEIDTKTMLKFTEMSMIDIRRNVKAMQETSITFIDEKEGFIEGMSLLPRYKIIHGKNKIQLDLYVKISKLIIDVKKNYTFMNIKSLMEFKSKHTIRLLTLLNRLKEYGANIPKRKHLTLEDMNEFFGTKYKTWGEIERRIISPVKEELDNGSALTFIYESNFENLGKGRPKFKNITIDLIERNNYQSKLDF
jgi:plasmid replication initiation protein